MIAQLEPCIKEYLDIHCQTDDCELCEHLLFMIEDPVCGKPITSVPEQLFAAAWVHEAWEDQVYSLKSQTAIGRYFADFTVSGLDHFVNVSHFNAEQLEIIHLKLPRYAIEIDGFEWHDRTPEQAESERQRARFIQSQRYTVLRFAAREVLREPRHCVVEVSRRIFSDIQSIYRTMIILP